jgi:predicted amidophosphoribosyltransferase
MVTDQELRWRKIDESDWLAHCLDAANSNLFYGRIYTKGQGYKYSKTNQLILNLKISPRDSHRLTHKRKAIEQFAEEVIDLCEQLSQPNRLYYLIPIPPSKSKTHPEYDDRIEQVARLIEAKFQNVTCLPLLFSQYDSQSSHTSNAHRNPQEIYQSIAVDSNLCSIYQAGGRFIVIDDVLTSGAHFSAARQHLIETYPEANISGLFWAKTEEHYIEDW